MAFTTTVQHKPNRFLYSIFTICITREKPAKYFCVLFAFDIKLISLNQINYTVDLTFNFTKRL